MKKVYNTPFSKRVSMIEYDEENLELKIFYRRGGTYVYFNVPLEIYEELINYPSIGKGINELIKPRFSFEKLLK